MKTFLQIPVDADDERQLRGVFAVLASPLALAAALAAIDSPKGFTMPSSAERRNAAAEDANSKDAHDVAEQVAPEASASSADVDAHGHPWSEDLHASTKGKTKDGLWRLKPGASRPDPLPGFPKEEAGNGGTGTPSPSAPEPSTEAAPSGDAGPATAEADEDDEFAAFATSASDAPADKPARSWSDADLSKLCNQAAQALGGPEKIKALIAKYVPEGATSHSRNILEEDREDFAQSVEAEAGIEFAG